MKKKITFYNTARVEGISEIMKLYLERFNVKSNGKEKEFCEKYWEMLVEKAVEEGARIPLPHNLGYIQALLYKYEGVIGSHLKKYGRLDAHLVWIKHPLFSKHKITFDKSYKNRILDNREKGVKYLTEYVDGDFYVVERGTN